jgi:hypothetical protein
MANIYFEPFEEFADHILDIPKPAKEYIPQWYKELGRTQTSYKHHILPDLSTNLTVKTCPPFLDALMSGYMITTPCDILAVKDPEYPNRLNWSYDFPVVDTHKESQIKGMPMHKEFETTPYKWNSPWVIKTPKNYSVLFTHPLNHFDLPFHTMSGVVDTDSYTMPVNFPFLLKYDFEGVIPKGTPIAQVIPIKRDAWSSKKLPFSEKSKFMLDDLRSTISRAYKENFWNKKEYL